MCEVTVLFDGYSKKFDDGTMDANCTCTLIKGLKLIIVDTMTAWDRERIIEALTQQNIEPANIDYVVCTHSHADHIGNNNLFTNAEHIVDGYELCPGVKVVASAGHTPEDVTVLVDTTKDGEKTRFAITGIRVLPLFSEDISLHL
ncbi:hypothetical protein DMN91_007450 [Ooceraea biroi]|uniref:Metallo-beta-lactamase domain-containing protein 1 n=1 Tax=Ooceraea biroi TaxID=2015173 RepID=A0A3L8DKG9_OOCBI|nr:hypothetical protein DMN91_007450 [Ooceraea biroi]